MNVGENNYTLGLLVASCVALLVAVVLTAVEITDYGEVALPVSRGVRTTAVEEGAGGGAEPSGEAVEETAPAEEAGEEGEAPAEEAATEGG
jgi:hypothetical protein